MLRLRFIFVALALLLAACFGSAKPETVVADFYQAAAKGDVEAATKLISLEQVPASSMLQAKGKIQMIVGEMQTRIASNDGLDGLEVLESKIDDSGKHALVRSKIKYKNGKNNAEISKLVKEGGSWKILLQ